MGQAQDDLSLPGDGSLLHAVLIGTVRFGDADPAVFDAQDVAAMGRNDLHGAVFVQGVAAVETAVHGDPHRAALLLGALQQRQAAEAQEQQGDGQNNIRFFEKGKPMVHDLLKKCIAGLLLTAVIISQTACTGQSGGQEGTGSASFGEDWLLNTYCYIQIPENGQEDTIRRAFSVARDYENMLSRTIESSDIGRFNASQGGCKVDMETALLLQDCRDAYALSGGLLDVTMGAVTSLWDFSAQEPKAPDADAVAEALRHVGHWEALGIEPEDGSPQNGWELLKDDPGMMLDLGAVAKGFIADRTASYLTQHGIERAVINFGGNVVFLGQKEDGSPWACGIEDPSEGQSEELIQERKILGTVRAVTGDSGQVSVVTSGTYERCFQQDGVLYHHVLDPRTGYPAATDLLSATVIGPSSEWCDILSTTCLLFGSERALSLIEGQEGYEAVFILQDGSILKTDGAEFTEQ